MPAKTIPTVQLKVSDVPADAADLENLLRFALSFDGYRHRGSFSRCAEIANARDHGSLDKLRTCLFFEARRWHHFGDSPDEEETLYWRWLVAEIRLRLQRLDSLSPQWLAQAIERLPPDQAVPDNTQRAHWLGWLSRPVSRRPRSSRWPASAPRSASSSLGTRWPKCSIHRLILPGGTHEKTANCRSAGNTGLSILSGDAQPNGLTPRQRCQLKPTSLLESRGGSE